MCQQWSAVLRESLHGLQVASYAFTFPDEDKNDTQIRIMLPLFDLLNHGNPGAALDCIASWVISGSALHLHYTSSLSYLGQLAHLCPVTSVQA